MTMIVKHVWAIFLVGTTLLDGLQLVKTSTPSETHLFISLSRVRRAICRMRVSSSCGVFRGSTANFGPSPKTSCSFPGSSTSPTMCTRFFGKTGFFEETARRLRSVCCREILYLQLQRSERLSTAKKKWREFFALADSTTEFMWQHTLLRCCIFLKSPVFSPFTIGQRRWLCCFAFPFV